MTRSPISIASDMMLVDAEALMLEKKIKALIVADQKKHIMGILEIFDR
jgi:predicted transcriptional regulator